MPQPSMIGGPSVETFGWLPHRPLALGLIDRRGGGDCHCVGDLVLDREDVSEITVVTLGPDVLAILGLDQLRGDADAVAGFAQAAFEDIANAELMPNLFHI